MGEKTTCIHTASEITPDTWGYPRLSQALRTIQPDHPSCRRERLSLLPLQSIQPPARMHGASQLWRSAQGDARHALRRRSAHLYGQARRACRRAAPPNRVLRSRAEGSRGPVCNGAVHVLPAHKRFIWNFRGFQPAGGRVPAQALHERYLERLRSLNLAPTSDIFMVSPMQAHEGGRFACHGYLMSAVD